MEIVNTPVNVTPPMRDAAYVETMVAKAEGRAPVAPVVPAVVPPVVATPAVETSTKKFAGKYDSVEAMEAGYLELQKAFSKKSVPAVAPVVPAVPVVPAIVPPVAPAIDPVTGLEIPAVVPAAAELSAEEIAAAAALESKGLDIETFNKEFFDTGTLSAESYEALAKAGIPQSVVDSYIAGQQLIANQLVTRVFDTAGGEAEYQKMMVWASTNTTPEQKAAYQAALDSNDIDKVLLAVKGLQADFITVKGKAPNLVTGSEAVETGDTYTSTEAMKADMKDIRYQKDPAFREMVRNKLSRSNIM
jgi:hypothetical protein